jgi:hypothetical protein
MIVNTSLWHQEILRAARAQDVLSTIHDYVVLWRPDELSQLPVPMPQLAEPRDVSEYAAALLQHEGDGRRSAAREALTAVFTLGARRLAELAASELPHETSTAQGGRLGAPL